MYQSTQQLLEAAEKYFSECVSPHAAQMDLDPKCLEEGLKGLCNLGMMGLKCPKEYGGIDCTPVEYGEFRELSARYSGALTFLKGQHQIAVELIAHTHKDSIKEEYLPYVSNGRKLLGIGISHLRRSDNPPIRAEVTDKGYLLNGFVPWVTGWQFYPEFVLGAMLSDGSSVFGIAPLIEQVRDGATLSVSDPIPLAVGTAANTVRVSFKDWLLPHDRVLGVKTARWLQRTDRESVLNLSFLALGGARGALDVLQKTSEKLDSRRILDNWEILDKELLQCRNMIIDAVNTPAKYTFKQKLALRTQSIELASRCAHAAVVGAGGSAILLDHPEQRLYRESLLYTILGQTSFVKEATLDCLSSIHMQ